MQETYAKALRGFSGFQAGTNFRAWIFRILRNTFLTSRTGLKLAGQEDVEVDSLASLDPSPEATLIGKADRKVVREALQDLPVPFREILLLCDVEDMAYEEIAQVLAIPVGTVMSRLYRARKALRGKLIESIQRRSAWHVNRSPKNSMLTSTANCWRSRRTNSEHTCAGAPRVQPRHWSGSR